MVVEPTKLFLGHSNKQTEECQCTALEVLSQGIRKYPTKDLPSSPEHRPPRNTGAEREVETSIDTNSVSEKEKEAFSPVRVVVVTCAPASVQVTMYVRSGTHIHHSVNISPDPPHEHPGIPFNV